MKKTIRGGFTLFTPREFEGRSGATNGFTITEIVVVIGIILILFLLENRSAFRPQQTVNIASTIDTLTADLASQQNKAMTGDQSVGSANSSYGVYFEASRYTLFRGASFNPTTSDNFTVDLNPTFTFSAIDLPSAQVIFATASGALTNYDQNQREVTITDTVNNLSRTIRFNSYGVVVSGD